MSGTYGGALPLWANAAAARARTDDPDTSHVAATSVQGRTQSLRERILSSLEKRGGATTHTIALRLNESLVTISPRMKPLEDAGYVERAGKSHGRTWWERTEKPYEG